MIKYNELDQTSYEDLRLQTISNIEENTGLSLLPYIDSVGIPSIGLGMNLRVKRVLDAVTVERFGIEELETYYIRIKTAVALSYPGKSESERNLKLQKALNDIMLDRYNDASIIGEKRSTFSFNNEQEVIDTFNAIAEYYENEINSRTLNVPFSSERAILFSLAYNNPALIGLGLRDAIQSGNRPEAWYQIRYQTNGGSSRGRGIAKRRYYESAIFGLYDDANLVSEAEAKAVFQTFTPLNVRTKIANYDAEFSSRIAKANSDYSTNIVKDFAESTKIARDLLTSLHAPNADINQVLVGDSSNVLIDNAKSTDPKTNSLILGEGDFDTYHFPTISGHDIIDDVDANGKIKIGGTDLSTLNSANAKFNSVTGEVIEGEWTLGSYYLTKNGDDLPFIFDNNSAYFI